MKKHKSKSIEEFDIEPNQNNKSKFKLIIPVIIITISIGITLACYFGNSYQDSKPTSVSTTRASEWIDQKRSDKVTQDDKYPDHSLPSIKVD